MSDISNYVDLAMKAARKHIAENQTTGRYAVKTDAEAQQRDSFHARINQDDPGIRKAVNQIVSDFSTNNPAKNEHSETSNLTYLAGPLGSKFVLQKLAADAKNQSPEIQGLRDLINTSVQLDLFKIKQDLIKFVGDNTSYVAVRPLLTGIKSALNEMLNDRKLNIVLDQTINGINDKERAKVIDQLTQEQSANNLHVFAVALSPNDAEKAAKNAGLSVSGGEDRKSARNFHVFFPQLLSKLDNITLFSPDGQVVVHKENGVIKTQNQGLLDEWQKKVDTETRQESQAPAQEETHLKVEPLTPAQEGAHKNWLAVYEGASAATRANMVKVAAAKISNVTVLDPVQAQKAVSVFIQQELHPAHESVV